MMTRYSKMKKLSIIIVAIILLAACAKHNSLIGNYHSAKPGYFTFLRYYLDGYSRYFSGSELIIKEDSTFNMITCANIFTGDWFCDDDSLYMQVKTNRWRNDSLQENGFNGTWPEIPAIPLAYKIKNGHFVKQGIGYSSPKKDNPRKVIEWLDKVN